MHECNCIDLTYHAVGNEVFLYSNAHSVISSHIKTLLHLRVIIDV